jgi:hypothetical protein
LGLKETKEKEYEDFLKMFISMLDLQTPSLDPRVENGVTEMIETGKTCWRLRMRLKSALKQYI